MAGAGGMGWDKRQDFGIRRLIKQVGERLLQLHQRDARGRGDAVELDRRPAADGVDVAGRYLTQCELPDVARIAVAPAGDGSVVLSASGMSAGALRVSEPEAVGPAVEVLIRRDRVWAQPAGQDPTV